MWIASIKDGRLLKFTDTVRYEERFYVDFKTLGMPHFTVGFWKLHSPQYQGNLLVTETAGGW